MAFSGLAGRFRSLWGEWSREDAKARRRVFEPRRRLKVGAKWRLLGVSSPVGGQKWVPSGGFLGFRSPSEGRSGCRLGVRWGAHTGALWATRWRCPAFDAARSSRPIGPPSTPIGDSLAPRSRIAFVAWFSSRRGPLYPVGWPNFEPKNRTILAHSAGRRRRHRAAFSPSARSTAIPGGVALPDKGIRVWSVRMVTRSPSLPR